MTCVYAQTHLNAIIPEFW